MHLGAKVDTDRALSTASISGGTGVALAVVQANSAAPSGWDAINATYPNATTEVYTYILGGVTQSIITVVYSDSTKQVLTSVTRT
jgi:hypothetical protein